MNDSDLRILDCNVLLNYFSGEDKVDIASARSVWEEGHIPGSVYADLIHDMTDKNNAKFLVPMPPAKQFTEAMSSYGVGEGTRVVLYDNMVNAFAARIWWMLRAFGFDNAAVLNGGWANWTKEERPVSSESSTYPPGNSSQTCGPNL